MLRTADEILDKLKEIKGFTTDTQLADFFGVKPNTISTWRKRGAPYDQIIALCDKEKIPIGWLIAGQLVSKYIEVDGKKVLTMADEPGLYKQAFIIEDGKIVKPEASEEKVDEFVYVPQVSGKISAGGGLVPENSVEMRIAFRRAWIMKRGDPKNMALIKVSGDSMEPTLQSGDLVLVDHGRDYLDPQGGIYAIAVDDTLMIKRLQPEYPNKKVQIISDNPKYKVMEAMIDQVHINGKVIWFGREIER